MPDTPTRRLRRLRPTAALALTNYPVGEYRMTLQADSFNTLFRVRASDESFVLRVGPALRIHAWDSARAEQRWTADLRGRGIRTPRIVPTHDGAPSVVVEGTGVDGPRECSLLSWTPGRTLQRPVTDDDLRDLAVLCAQLHEASPPCRVRPAGALDGRHALHFEIPSLVASVDGRDGEVLRVALERAQAGVDALWHDAVDEPRLIHTDLTPNNLVRGRPGLTAIDFQDLTWGHVPQDLANALYGLTRGRDVDAALRPFRAAYEQVRPWPSMAPELLDDLVAARRLEMVNLALTRRRPDLADYVRGHVEALSAYLNG